MKKVFPFLQKTLKGFSLVEIIVVLGLFSGISTLILGALFNAQAINGRLQESQAILDNVNLSMQTISRDIRFGTNFNCLNALPEVGSVPTQRGGCSFLDGNGGTVLLFRPSSATSPSDRVAYYVRNGILYKEEYPYGGASTTLQMTANDVSIKSLAFFAEGAHTSDGSNDPPGFFDYKQPLITMMISGFAKPSTLTVDPVTFDLQVTISAREIDNR